MMTPKVVASEWQFSMEIEGLPAASVSQVSPVSLAGDVKEFEVVVAVFEEDGLTPAMEWYRQKDERTARLGLYSRSGDAMGTFVVHGCKPQDLETPYLDSSSDAPMQVTLIVTYSSVEFEE